MGMPILESGTFLLVESGILKICLVESGILGFAIWNPAKDCNPESKFHWQRIRNPRCGIQNPRLFDISLHRAKWKNGSVNSLPTHDVGMSPPTYIFAITRDYQMHNAFFLISTLDDPWEINPLSPKIHIQILQTDLHTFPSRISWENLIKDHGIFP